MTFRSTHFSWCENFHAAFQLSTKFLGMLEHNIPILPSFHCQRGKEEEKCIFPTLETHCMHDFLNGAVEKKDWDLQQTDAGDI